MAVRAATSTAGERLSGGAGRVISLTDVTIAYDRHPIVHHLTGSFGPGAPTALIGPNGAGKSTLLRAIAGLLPLRSGRVEMEPAQRHELAFLPQAADVDRSFPLSVIDVVDLAIGETSVFQSIAARRRRSRVAAMVGFAGIKRPSFQLSLGQLQRTLFAPGVRTRHHSADNCSAPFRHRCLMSIIEDEGEGRTVGGAATWNSDSSFPRPPTAREAVAWGPTGRAERGQSRSCPPVGAGLGRPGGDLPVRGLTLFR
jgi:zinc/manganese transport system ATP-binding protein